MTTTTAHAGHHINPTMIGAAFAGALLAAGAGFGIANVVLDDVQVGAPASSIGSDVMSEYDVDRYPGFDPNGYAGTDREDRSLQHRR